MAVEGSSNSWECPALAKAGSLLLPLVLEMWLCVQELVAPALVTGGKGSSACPCSPGQEQRQLELQKLWAGAWAATKGLCLEKGWGETEEQRAPTFSSWVSYQVLLQCVFHSQSSQLFVEIPAFAVAQLGHPDCPVAGFGWHSNTWSTPTWGFF